MRATRRAALGGLATILILGMAPSATAAIPPTAPPPATADLTAATNAMLSFDVAPVLAAGSDSRFTTGYINPPGGQDPLPVCYVSGGRRSVAVPDTLAVGYMATNGFVTQSEYVYPSAADGARAWAKLSAAIAKNCSGTWTDDGDSWTTTRTRLPADGAAGAGWAVTTVTNFNVLHSAVVPVDGGIQMVSYVRQSPTLKSGVTAAINALSGRLADRWAARATAPNTQGPLITGAQSSMLQPDLVPAATPVTQPQAGGWANWNANAPGNGPMTCAFRSQVPAGSWTFTSSLGGWGDITAEPGALVQYVETYQTDDAARVAWRKLRALVLSCDKPDQARISATKPIQRSSSGEAGFGYAGVPAVWSRDLDTDPNAGFSMKSYTVHLLAGNVIQSVTYYLTREEIAALPLDQLAVNELAETLITRWVAAQ